MVCVSQGIRCCKFMQTRTIGVCAGASAFVLALDKLHCGAPLSFVVVDELGGGVTNRLLSSVSERSERVAATPEAVLELVHRRHVVRGRDALTNNDRVQSLSIVRQLPLL